MKRIFALLAVVTAIGIVAPTSASAYDHCYPGARRVVGYQSCGTPIFAVYQMQGYDSCGRPMGVWVTQTPAYCPPRVPAYCPPPSYCPPPACPPSYGGGYGRSRAHFPVPVRPHGGGLSIFFGR